MQRNVLEYLENIVDKVPDKTAYANDTEGVTFREVYDRARAIGSYLAANGFYREPVVVFMQKHPNAIVGFYGVAYGGCTYVPIDEEMPKHRIELIFKALQPRLILCDEVTRKMAEEFDFGGQTVLYSEICDGPVSEEALAQIRAHQIDTDPLYIVFTSGSTGVPKGVIACHRSVIDYIEQLSKVLRFDGDTVFGNQTPLYFDACLKELYPTLKFGATAYLIPKQLFMFPIKLVEFLNEKKINTICWVVSALTMISAFGTFKTVVPQYLRTVAFGSEVFPIKQFNLWKQTLPQTRFVNLYGPTEATGMSCWYEADREFGLDEVIPIGRPFENTEILLLDDENRRITGPGVTGEICIRGTAVTLGYFNNPEKTAESFVQNPLNTAYPELIYRTGDIGRYDEHGDLLFNSRKDYQIKHMGHRIELGEIEAIVNQHDAIRSACCIFDDDKKKIVLYYVGDVESKDLTVFLKGKLPRYMVPNSTRQLSRMPLTANGKLDRNTLKKNYLESR